MARRVTLLGNELRSMTSPLEIVWIIALVFRLMSSKRVTLGVGDAGKVRLLSRKSQRDESALDTVIMLSRDQCKDDATIRCVQASTLLGIHGSFTS